MTKQANKIKFLLCRMAEDDVIQNLDTGDEYTGFKELVNIIPRNYISKHGIAYDIDDYDECGHIIKFIDDVKDEPEPKLDITCGSFFSRNKQLQDIISIKLNTMANNNIPVSIYAAGSDTGNFFEASVTFMSYNRNAIRVPHFMKTNERFLLELPHTEKSQVRVDIISDMFDKLIKKSILDYLSELVLGLKRRT